MGGRGTFASGNQVDYTYKIVGFIEDAKVLEGNDKFHHSLPVESHSSNKYIKLNPDGSFRELRVYSDDHYLQLEIAYHHESSLKNDENGKALHYHLYDKKFNRTKALPITDEIFEKYKKYMKGVKK